MCECIPLLSIAFDAGSELEIVELHLDKATFCEAVSDQKELCSQLADALRQLVEGRAKAGQPAVALCMLSCQEPDYDVCEFCGAEFERTEPGSPEAATKGDTSYEELAKHFDKPIKAASKELGICTTILKRICRNNGLSRWPYRKIKKAGRHITETREAALQALAAPGFQLLAGSIINTVEDLNRRRGQNHIGEGTLEDTPCSHIGLQAAEHQA